jgi:serine/threonine protein kinase
MVLPPYKALNVGDTLDGRYTLRGKLGEGAYGTVFLAEHLYTKRTVAVKVLREDALASEEALKRFIREAQLASELDHQNCVRTHEFGKSQTGQYYLVMERLDGETLGARLDRLKRLTLQESRAIMGQLLAALGAAHRKGIVHRDIKPDNIMLVRSEGGDDIVKIVDFGFAKKPGSLAEAMQTGDAITKLGMAMGTPEYLAPEQAQGGEIDQRTDLYSAGIILYRMLVGKPPFENDNPLDTVLDQIKKQPPAPRTAAPDAMIPGSVEGLILRALCKKPDERYPDAFSFSVALDAALNPSQPFIPVESVKAAAPEIAAPSALGFSDFFEPVGTREFWTDVGRGKWKERPYWTRLAVIALAPSFIIFAALWKLFNSSPVVSIKATDILPATQVVTAKELPDLPLTTTTTSQESQPTTAPETMVATPTGTLQDALDALAEKDAKTAIAILEDLSTTDANNAELWKTLTRAYAIDERWDEALNAWTETKNLDSKADLSKEVLELALHTFADKTKRGKAAQKFLVKASPAQAAPRVEERLKNNSQRAVAAATLADIGKIKGYNPVPALLKELNATENCETKVPIVEALSQFPKDKKALSALKEEGKSVRLRTKNRCLAKTLPAIIENMEKKK